VQQRAVLCGGPLLCCMTDFVVCAWIKSGWTRIGWLMK
jgi:hypothetical protein